MACVALAEGLGPTTRVLPRALACAGWFLGRT
jgi:hypothetical protein